MNTDTTHTDKLNEKLSEVFNAASVADGERVDDLLCELEDMVPAGAELRELIHALLSWVNVRENILAELDRAHRELGYITTDAGAGRQVHGENLGRIGYRLDQMNAVSEERRLRANRLATQLILATTRDA